MGKPVPLARFLQLCGGGEYCPHVAARRLRGSAGEENRVRQRWRIPQSPRQSYCLSMAMHGAGRTPEYPLCGCAKSERAYRRIMSEIDVAVMREAFLFIEGKARITMLYGLREPTAMPSHWPSAVMHLQHDLGVIEIARDPEKSGGSLLSLIE